MVYSGLKLFIMVYNGFYHINQTVIIRGPTVVAFEGYYSNVMILMVIIVMGIDGWWLFMILMVIVVI